MRISLHQINIQHLNYSPYFIVVVIICNWNEATLSPGAIPFIVASAPHEVTVPTQSTPCTMGNTGFCRNFHSYVPSQIWQSIKETEIKAKSVSTILHEIIIPSYAKDYVPQFSTVGSVHVNVSTKVTPYDT